MNDDPYVTKCELCQRAINIRSPRTAQFLSGWALNRTGGGAHSVMLPKREDRWAHKECIERVANHGMLQPALDL
jgi:hypothetical protein